MNEVWKLNNKRADFDHITKTFGVSPVLAHLLVNKGLSEDVLIDAYLHPVSSSMHSYRLLKDSAKAVAIIAKAIDNGDKIRIVGDYDVDGVTSTYLLMDCFQSLGAFVTYRIPERLNDGYGISERIVEEAHADGISLIVTCDNGVSAVASVKLARELGMDVVVTDHHEPPDVLPEADAIVDPKLSDCDYPFKGICGAVVAAKICEALYEHYDYGSFIDSHLDIMALGTVCDVMELVDENRYIVKKGLEMINAGSNFGLSVLGEVTGASARPINTYTLGFVLGPCLNAAGRLEIADYGVELLSCTDKIRATEIAGKLKDLNEERKDKTVQGLKAAEEIIDSQGLNDDNILIVSMPCHESVCGIIAGRIKEKYNRPAFVLSESTSEPGMLKGSGRSVEAYDMFEGLKAVDEYLFKYGGHTMAAGLSIKAENLDGFRRAINENCDIDLKNLPKEVMVDLFIPPSSFSEAIVKELEKLEPTGTGNARSVFADKAVIKRVSVFGNKGEHLRIAVTDSRGNESELKAFNKAEEFGKAFAEKYGEAELEACYGGRGQNGYAALAYYPEINEFRGVRSVQCKLNNYKFLDKP